MSREITAFTNTQVLMHLRYAATFGYSVLAASAGGFIWAGRGRQRGAGQPRLGLSSVPVAADSCPCTILPGGARAPPAQSMHVRRRYCGPMI
jgi:hypothetical protein